MTATDPPDGMLIVPGSLSPTQVVDLKRRWPLQGRCGTCRRWSPWSDAGGDGSCDLPREPGSPVRLTDGGGLTTRIDFTCAWHETGGEPVR